MPAVNETIDNSRETERQASLVKSMFITIGILQLVQAAIFAAYALAFGFFRSYALWFTISSAGFHAVLLTMLFLFRNDFVRDPSGERLWRINPANLVTLFRISTLPTIMIIIFASKDYPIRYPLVALVAAVFATDFLDGWISRATGDKTRVGKMMDSASDYTLLFVISIAYYYFKLVPLWFFAVLSIRLVSQAIMILVILAVKKRVTPRTSFMGKATVACTMVLYALELLRFVSDLPRLVYTVSEWIVGAVVLLSIADKIIIMAKDLKTQPKANPLEGRLAVPGGDEHAH